MDPLDSPNFVPTEQMVLDSLRLVGGLRSPTGKTFHVNSASVRKANKPGAGSKWSPFSTLDYAIGQCVAGRGDHILVWPEHAETISGAGGVALDVSHVRVIGLGKGTKRPTFTMSAVGSTFDMSAANCGVHNLLFSSTAACTRIIQLKDGCTDCEVTGNRIADGTAAFVTAIEVGHANVARVNIEGNTIRGATATNGVKIAVAGDELCVVGNEMNGSFSVGGIAITAAATNCRIRANRINNSHATGKRLTVKAAATGYFTEDDNGGAGTTFMIRKLAIPATSFVTANTDISLASIGEIYIRDTYLKSNATGTLGGATALLVATNNAGGESSILTQAVAGLATAGNAIRNTIRGTGGSTVRYPTILEAGKKVQVGATGADATGTTLLDVYLVCERITPGAWLESV